MPPDLQIVGNPFTTNAPKMHATALAPYLCTGTPRVSIPPQHSPPQSEQNA